MGNKNLYWSIAYFVMFVLVTAGYFATKDTHFVIMSVILFVGESVRETFVSQLDCKE